MSGLTASGLRVPKTIKLFIGGEFPRTESGRSYPVYEHNSKKVFAHLCRASRKDFRNAVGAAIAAGHSWESRAAYNRGQILYRMAESHRDEMVSTLTRVHGASSEQANAQVDGAIDAFVYYSGFADKFQQLIGSVNPVTGPHHCFTTPEPVGVVAAIFGDDATLSQVVATLAAILVSGNTIVALLPPSVAPLLASISEVFATSDLPKGVVNLLTGTSDELLSQMASHMEVQSVTYQGAKADQGANVEQTLSVLKSAGAENMKRVVPPFAQELALQNILGFVEYKTVWHPVGH